MLVCNDHNGLLYVSRIRKNRYSSAIFRYSAIFGRHTFKNPINSTNRKTNQNFYCIKYKATMINYSVNVGK